MRVVAPAFQLMRALMKLTPVPLPNRLPARHELELTPRRRGEQKDEKETAQTHRETRLTLHFIPARPFFINLNCFNPRRDADGVEMSTSSSTPEEGSRRSSMDLEAILAASDSDSGGENDFSEQFTLEDILREHDDVEVRVEMPKSSSSSSAAAGRRASPAPDSAALRASPSPSSAAAADRDASSLDFALGLGLDDSSSDDDARPVSPLSEDDVVRLGES